MAVAISIQDVNESRRSRVRTCKLVFSGSYVTGGDTIDLTAATNPNNMPAAKFARNPVGFSILNDTPGYKFYLIPGANLTNWKIQVRQDAGTNNPFAEIAAAGYPGAITGDANIRIEFRAPKNL